MTNSLTNLRGSLEKAVNMIDESLLLPIEEAIHSDSLGLPMRQLNFTDATSLLGKCDDVNEQYQDSKPVIRIIHHFACSGGTLVSKCLSAMPNVFLLSEVHPHTDLQRDKQKPQYSPSDLAKLAIYAGVPEQQKLAEKIFVDSIKAAYLHIAERGGTLILRDHTHSDYCVGDTTLKNTVAELLGLHFKIISLVTLRNPIDSYLSLVANGWVHFNPATFDEYCARLLAFLKPFTQTQIVSYDDFVGQPQQVLEKICYKLQIPFSDTFEDIFDSFFVTGDSGRKSQIIKPRERRPVTDQFHKEVASSNNFKIVCEHITVINELESS